MPCCFPPFCLFCAEGKWPCECTDWTIINCDKNIVVNTTLKLLGLISGELDVMQNPSTCLIQVQLL